MGASIALLRSIRQDSYERRNPARSGALDHYSKSTKLGVVPTVIRYG